MQCSSGKESERPRALALLDQGKDIQCTRPNPVDTQGNHWEVDRTIFRAKALVRTSKTSLDGQTHALHTVALWLGSTKPSPKECTTTAHSRSHEVQE